MQKTGIITHTFSMQKFNAQLDDNVKKVKDILSASDIFFHFAVSSDEVRFVLIYTDGLVDKSVLGDLVLRPVESHSLKNKTVDDVKKLLPFPEVKTETDIKTATDEILNGNTVLLAEGIETALIIGAKFVPTRSVSEPQTDIAVKGPREGFVEDIKINTSLIRKRLKTPDLQFDSVSVGKQSNTLVSVAYIKGVAEETVLEEVKEKLRKIDVDVVVDSSYISAFLTSKKHSVFRFVGTTEKPDIFTAKIAEGRVGILVDGSPIALTVPFLAVEDFQSAEDYFVSPFFATITRFLRLFALLISLLLPAFYVSTQLFKLQLLPLGLTLTIASSIQGIPLSPSLEMFLVLFILEVIKEASVRMPKYVAMALSIVGALVLGETAVSAGFVSTPAIIVVAFSGICLYTVPNFVETGSIVRWIFLIVAGSVGPFGIVLLSAYLLYYLSAEESFGSPTLSPFSPLIKTDLKDTVLKTGLLSQTLRPKSLRSKNKMRLKEKQ